MIEKRFCLAGLHVKEDSDGRTITGLASTFEAPENHDSHGDIIAPDAFDEVLELVRRGKRTIKMLDSHGAPIGKWSHFAVTPEGLRVSGRVSKVPDGDAVLELVKDGVTDGLSIGFSVNGSLSRDREEMTQWGFPVLEWMKVNLREVSPTPFPSNENAHVEEVRSARAQDWQTRSRRAVAQPIMKTLAVSEATFALKYYEHSLNRIDEIIKQAEVS